MNAKHYIAAIIAVAAASAHAQSNTAPAQPQAVADARLARADGTNGGADTAPVRPASAAPGLTRAQVIAELLEARKNGTIPVTEADFDVAQTRKHFAK